MAADDHPPILAARAVRLGLAGRDRAEVIDRCGAVLVELGAVDPPYVAAMHERERSVSTYVGRGVALPHGTVAARRYVRRTAVAVLQFPGGVHWDGHRVSLCIPIAAAGDEHTQLLSSLARMLLDERRAAELRHAADPSTVLRLLSPADGQADERAYDPAHNQAYNPAYDPADGFASGPVDGGARAVCRCADGGPCDNTNDGG